MTECSSLVVLSKIAAHSATITKSPLSELERSHSFLDRTFSYPSACKNHGMSFRGQDSHCVSKKDRYSLHPCMVFSAKCHESYAPLMGSRERDRIEDNKRELSKTKGKGGTEVKQRHNNKEEGKMKRCIMVSQ